MLLPPTLSCNMYSQQQPKVQRPKLLSFAPYEATSFTRPAPTGLLASCRALQSILGGPVQPVLSPLTASATIPSVHLPNPFAAPRPRLQSPSRIFTPARGLNKRRRDEDEGNSNANNVDHMDIDTELRHPYQTPKRLRRIPADIPMGLGASDFESLNTPHPPQSSERMDEDPPLNPSEDHFPMADSYNQEEQITWSSEEDHQILDTVLNKFNFSMRDWNDCARQLGRDQDSLGRRFKVLMGDDNLCLRRGAGRMERPGLDVESW